MQTWKLCYEVSMRLTCLYSAKPVFFSQLISQSTFRMSVSSRGLLVLFPRAPPTADKPWSFLIRYLATTHVPSRDTVSNETSAFLTPMWPSCRPAVCSRWCIWWENWRKRAAGCSRDRLIADSTQLTHPSKMSVTCHSIQRVPSWTENKFCCRLTWGQQDTGVCLMFDWEQQPYWMFFCVSFEPWTHFKRCTASQRLETNTTHLTAERRREETHWGWQTVGATVACWGVGLWPFIKHLLTEAWNRSYKVKWTTMNVWTQERQNQIGRDGETFYLQIKRYRPCVHTIEYFLLNVCRKYVQMETKYNFSDWCFLKGWRQHNAV